VNDIAKCGVYTDAKEFFDAAAQSSRQHDTTYVATDGATRMKRPLPVVCQSLYQSLIVPQHH
jgi:hypothetical protein